MKHKKKRIALLTILALTVLLILFCHQYVKSFMAKPLNLTEEQQIFVLNKNTSATKFVQQIKDQKLIDNAFVLSILMRIVPSYNKIKSGTYLLSKGMNVTEFIALLISGKETQFAIKFIEGTTFNDWLKVLKQNKHIKQALSKMTKDEIKHKLELGSELEGFFYPDTYYYTMNTTDIEILSRAHQKMKKILAEIWNEKSDNLPYKNPYELLTMASVIEKETHLDDERELVASVFINRLNRKMPLQTDPAVIYGIGDNFNGRLLKSNLMNKHNRYNTYIIEGLPPTPIAMPSLASLKAAANPATTEYLFFVATREGGHVFSKNYQDHKKAVDEYWQLNKSVKP